MSARLRFFPEVIDYYNDVLQKTKNILAIPFRNKLNEIDNKNNLDRGKYIGKIYFVEFNDIPLFLKELRLIKTFLRAKVPYKKSLIIFNKANYTLINADINDFYHDYNQLSADINTLESYKDNLLYRVNSSIENFEDDMAMVGKYFKKYKHYDTSKYSETDKRVFNNNCLPIIQCNANEIGYILACYTGMKSWLNFFKEGILDYERIILQIRNEKIRELETNPSKGLQTIVRAFNNLLK